MGKRKNRKSKRLLTGVFFIVCLVPLVLFVYRWCSNRDYIKWSDYKIYYMSEIPVEPQDFKADFEDIFQKVNHRYPYIQEKQLNMDSVYNACMSRLDTIRQKTDYAKLLCEFFAYLKGGHARVSFHPHHIGNDVVVIEDHAFISNPSKEALKAGLMDKDEIVTINHIPTLEWIRKNEKFVAASTDAARFSTSALEITYDYTESVRTFEIRRGNELSKLTIHLLNVNQRSGKEWKKVEQKKLNSKVGYIAINTFSEPEVVPLFVKALEELRALSNLIIDVRTNGGGNSRYGDQIAEYLIKDTCKNWKGDQLLPNKNRYTGKVFILVGPETVSAAETFLVALKESGDVVLVGEPSHGDMGGVVMPYRSVHGICFTLPIMPRITTPGGHPMEGTPIQPDYLVHKTVKDFMEGKDTQIEYILTLLGIISPLV